MVDVFKRIWQVFALVTSEAFTMAKVNNIFSGYQPCQLIKHDQQTLSPTSGVDVTPNRVSFALSKYHVDFSGIFYMGVYIVE
jgi:hypothetical protein